MKKSLAYHYTKLWEIIKERLRIEIALRGTEKHNMMGLEVNGYYVNGYKMDFITDEVVIAGGMKYKLSAISFENIIEIVDELTL